MIIVEGSTQRLVEDGRKFFRKIRVIHAVIAVLMLATGAASLVFSLGSDGDAQIPYFFSAFVAGPWTLILPQSASIVVVFGTFSFGVSGATGILPLLAGHVVFVLLCQVCVHYLARDRRKLKEAPFWVNVYTVGCSIFVIFNVMGIVFTVVNGMCIRGQLCYYDKNEVANRSLAITNIFLHFVSILLSVFLAKKSHVIDSQLREDITIRINHSFIWGKRKSSTKSKSSAHPSISSSEFSSSVNEISAEGDVAPVRVQDGAVMVHTNAASWVDKKRIIIKTNRSKSHPNLRKHMDTNQEIEGTVFSIYSDTEDKPDEQKQRRGKRRQMISKRNRVTPTKSARDQPDTARDSPTTDSLNTQCDIEISNPVFTVRVIEQQRKEQLNRSLLNVKETGLLSLSRESSAVPSVDGRTNTDESIVLNQDAILKQQELVLKQQEQLQHDQRYLLKQQQEFFKQQWPLSADPNVPSPSYVEPITPPPPYIEKEYKN